MASERLNVTDVCDVVEFHESAGGVALYGQEGRWTPSTQRGGKKMDYVTHLKPDGTYQPLREHEENVAALAAEFAAAFGAGARPSDGAAARHRQIQRQRAETAARSGAHS